MSSAGPALLAVPGCAQERDFLRQLFGQSGWEVHLAQTFQEVLTALREERIGVLLSESWLSDGHCWKDLLDEIQRLESPPMLIVADRLADERLWAEVLNLGGYDLLLKPLDPDEALRVANSAWTSWKLGRSPDRHQAA
jgi:DNA-binding NtrC family response regulator